MTSPTGAPDLKALIQAANDGYEINLIPALADPIVRGDRDTWFLRVENPNFQPDNGANPFLVVDLSALLTRIESDAAESERQRAEIELLLRQRTRLMERVVKAETSLRAVASGGATKRCLFTGNPVGTDTWKVGSECQCVMCADTRRAALQTEAPDHA